MFPHCTVCLQLHWDYDHRQRQPSLRKYQDHNKQNNCLTPIPHANDIHYIIIIMTTTATPTYDIMESFTQNTYHDCNRIFRVPTNCVGHRDKMNIHTVFKWKTQKFILRSVCSWLRILRVATFRHQMVLLTILIATNARDYFVFSSSFLF